MGIRAYLDWNATAPLRPEARAAMAAAMDVVGNPSSVHAEGRAGRRLVEDAREQVAALVGAAPRNVIFTSGGTEANALALTPGLQQDESGAPARLLMSTIEHPSVRSGGRFAAVAQEDIPVTGVGVVDTDWLAHRLAELSGSRSLVSLMLANNETGVVQPVAAVAEAIHAHGGLLHVDAVQAAGKISCDINALGADLLTVSAHKLGGPKGVGALILADEGLHLADPLLKGGGQEGGRRAGTENVLGIAGFGAAAQAARASLPDDGARMAAGRDRLEARVREIAPETVIFGADAPRLPNTTLLAMPGIRAETALIALDLEGVAVSSGSACSSGKVAPSHVLAAMGVPPELALGAIRVSLGPITTDDEIEMFLKAWTKRVIGLSRARRGLAA
ncbi:MAG: cysteine desulfurase [Xanthobacteraceae bacterium]|nr:cysteine desulfurase [Xanthobacteraceae bacterium]